MFRFEAKLFTQWAMTEVFTAVQIGVDSCRFGLDYFYICQ
jgi:hypothetical protein